MPLKDFIEKFQYDPENFDIEKFKLDVLNEHNTDEGVLTAKIDDETKQRGDLADELKKQKLRNYDLLDKIPAVTKSPAEQQQEQNDEADISIDSLFGGKKD